MTDFKAARIAMVDCQVRPSDVTKYPIIDALLSVPREEFVPDAKMDVAYAGETIQLSAERALLDARVFAKMLDAVNISPEDSVLDIGCGLGYSTAIIAKMAHFVVGVESDADMAAQAEKNLSDQEIDNAYVQSGNLPAGAAKHGPYDVMILQGAVSELPSALTDQVKVGGRICAIFTDGAAGQCQIGIRTENGVAWRQEFDAIVPALESFAAKPVFTFA